jgi:hypothetical protein
MPPFRERVEGEAGTGHVVGEQHDAEVGSALRERFAGSSDCVDCEHTSEGSQERI